jgi:hypothetical protein
MGFGPQDRSKFGTSNRQHMNTLLVVADFAGFKAFKLENNNHLNRTPRLEMLDRFDNLQAHGRLVERVSDLSGRFPRGTGLKNGGAMSDGERHNIALESRKRLVRQMAQRLNELARRPEVERCFLAASREINHQLVDQLEPRVRAKIARNLSADLTKLDRTEILRHFQTGNEVTPTIPRRSPEKTYPRRVAVAV